MSITTPPTKCCLLLRFVFVAAVATATVSTMTASDVFVVEALPEFRDRIPNGRSVPNPYVQSSSTSSGGDGDGGGPSSSVVFWSGVGHTSAGGGGPRNPFGQDFQRAGFQWTVDLCETDSDGDGRTNGVELGDPDCIWYVDGPDPPSGPAVSHPGIVDDPLPVNDDGTLVGADSADTCATYVEPDDVIQFDVAFTSPNVLDGTQRTEYVCEQFVVDGPSVPSGQAYFHQVRQSPLEQNSDVLHHIWIYLCPSGVDSSDGNKVGQGSYSCDGIEGNCVIISGWALGMGDVCEPSVVGAGVDFSSESFGSDYGTAVLKVEAHYDNANLVSTTDQSGMRMHLTPTLRPLEAGQVILGTDYWDRLFSLPAAETDIHTRVNSCPPAATLMALTEPVYVYAWNPHMHLYGTSLVTEHYRCGVKIGEIGRIDSFEFDNQQSYALPSPVKVLPGDALVTTCTYNTSTANVDVVIGGEETTDEMCDNYLSYYPSAYTPEVPGLFQMCVTYEQGLNPALAGFDDTSPFALLDLAGEIWIDGSEYSTDPTSSFGLPECCTASDSGQDACEAQWLAANGKPCGTDKDCQDGLVCDGGLCFDGKDGKGDSSSSASSNEDAEPVLVDNTPSGTVSRIATVFSTFWKAGALAYLFAVTIN